MKLRTILLIAFILGVIYSNSLAESAVKPNVIIILTDDQGAGDFSFTGNPLLKTPNIDRLSKQGILFSDFHVAPMCTPTRGQLLTGKDALHNGAFLVCSGYGAIYPEVPTMPEILAKEGYATGLFGKWHLGDNYPYRPMDRGFETAVWHKGWGITSVADYWNNDYFDDYYFRNDSLLQFEGYCTDIWFNEAMDWMKKCAEAGRPFFTYLPTNAPHGPFYVENRYREPYKSAGEPVASFFGMIASIDENIGRLESMLELTGLTENTILIFMTDNGGTAGVPFYNAGLRGRKMSLYDGGHRVPCIVRWPGGRLVQNTEISNMVQVQDILPTLLELCHVETDLSFDGISVAGVMKGEKQAELDSRISVVQYGRQPWTVLEIPRKYDACVMWDKWRLVDNKELYDIKSDRAQENDLAEKFPDIVQKMSDYYEQWWTNAEYDVYHRFNPYYLGTGIEKVDILTSHDWMTLNTANAINIRRGENRNGAWNIRVVEEGDYHIELCRWPREANLKITESSPEYQAVDAVFGKGRALPIVRANLRIGIQEYSVPVSDGDYSAVFNIHLKKGNSSLQTTFYDKERNQVCGAYYVYVTRK